MDRFERLEAYPTLTARRLLRELKERGFPGSYSVVGDRVREFRPARSAGYETRFETPPGDRAQVDFARFEVEFADEPGIKRIATPPSAGVSQPSDGSDERAFPH